MKKKFITNYRFLILLLAISLPFLLFISCSMENAAPAKESESNVTTDITDTSNPTYEDGIMKFASFDTCDNYIKENAENLTSIEDFLNEDKIFQIDQWIAKVNLEKSRVSVLNEKYKDQLEDLINDNFDNENIYWYSVNDDIVNLLEEEVYGTITAEELKDGSYIEKYGSYNSEPVTIEQTIEIDTSNLTYGPFVHPDMTGKFDLPDYEGSLSWVGKRNPLNQYHVEYKGDQAWWGGNTYTLTLEHKYKRDPFMHILGAGIKRSIMLGDKPKIGLYTVWKIMYKKRRKKRWYDGSMFTGLTTNRKTGVLIYDGGTRRLRSISLDTYGYFEIVNNYKKILQCRQLLPIYK